MEIKERCGAWSRHSQAPCKKYPMAGRKRCRNHGGVKKTASGQLRSAQSNYKHGFYSADGIVERRRYKELLKEAKSL